MNFHDREFESQEINLDDNVYTGCSFRRCRIVYNGTGDVLRLSANHFDECTWEFRGSAGNTLATLRQMYHGGMRDLVEQTIANIRAP